MNANNIFKPYENIQYFSPNRLIAEKFYFNVASKLNVLQLSFRHLISYETVLCNYTEWINKTTNPNGHLPAQS